MHCRTVLLAGVALLLSFASRSSGDPAPLGAGPWQKYFDNAELVVGATVVSSQQTPEVIGGKEAIMAVGVNVKVQIVLVLKGAVEGKTITFRNYRISSPLNLRAAYPILPKDENPDQPVVYMLFLKRLDKDRFELVQSDYPIAPVLEIQGSIRHEAAQTRPR